MLPLLQQYQVFKFGSVDLLIKRHEGNYCFKMQQKVASYGVLIYSILIYNQCLQFEFL